MRIVVTGSRNWPEGEWLQVYNTILNHHLNKDNQPHSDFSLGFGDASGVDKYAEKYATHNGVVYRKFYADWDSYGKRAGPIRNRDMLDVVKPSLLLAFFIPGEENRGTWDCVEAAQERKIRVEPFRLK